MNRYLPVAVSLLTLAACGESPVGPDRMDPPLALARTIPQPPGLSGSEQELLDAFNAGADMGAMLNRDVGCAILTGFFTPSGLAAFGILGPSDCSNGNFDRTNPDGTVDRHMQGEGSFFLFVTGPDGMAFPSAGSDVRWGRVQHEDGITVFNVSGTLSDGSRVRAHFTRTADGKNPPGNRLWVEALGYVVGGK